MREQMGVGQRAQGCKGLASMSQPCLATGAGDSHLCPWGAGPAHTPMQRPLGCSHPAGLSGPPLHRPLLEAQKRAQVTPLGAESLWRCRHLSSSSHFWKSPCMGWPPWLVLKHVLPGALLVCPATWSPGFLPPFWGSRGLHWLSSLHSERQGSQQRGLSGPSPSFP